MDWQFRQPIIIDKTKVSGTQTDFPVYIDLADLSPHFWDNVSSTGADIRVYKSDNTTEVPVEVVAIDTDEETGTLFFKGDISSSADTTFYLYYGNASATLPSASSTYGSQNVWSDYVGVWHLNEDSTTKGDSTGNSDGTVTGTVTLVDGKFGKASHFDATVNSNIFVPDPAGLTNFDTPDSYAISFWVRKHSTTGDTSDKSVSEHWETGGTPNGYPWAIRGFGTNSTSMTMNLFNGGTGAPSGVSFNPGSGSTGSIGLNTWGFVTYVKNRNILKIQPHLNGVAVGSGGNDTIPEGDSTASLNNGFVIGERTSLGTTRTPNLDIQEFRIYDGVKSASTILTEYNNQSSPSTFYTVLSPQTINGWTLALKPTTSSWTNSNPVGRTQYDQSDITYDDPNMFYDGIDYNSWTAVTKPSTSNWQNVTKPS